MDTIQLIRNELKTAHEWFEGTMMGVDPVIAHHTPGGMTHPIGSRYAHAVVSEDMLVNTVLKGGSPLYAAEWAGKSGLQDPQAAIFTTLEWAQGVQVDLESLKAYAQAVYAESDGYLATLKAADLDREIDLSAFEMGIWSLGSFLISFLIGHMHAIMGEISALKGVHGLQGYPF